MNRSSLKVLEAIMRLADAGRPITVRAIMRACRWKSPLSVQNTLRGLRSRGMIDYEPRLFGTIRPKCRFIPVEFLEVIP